MNCTRPGGWFAISDQIGNKCIDSGVQTITMEVGSAAARRGLSPESPAATERWTMPRGRPNRQPSARNLELYHELVCEGRSRREVAARFRLSRPRVTQLRGQVADWVAQPCCRPASPPKVTPDAACTRRFAFADCSSKRPMESTWTTLAAAAALRATSTCSPPGSWAYCRGRPGCPAASWFGPPYGWPASWKTWRGLPAAAPLPCRRSRKCQQRSRAGQAGKDNSQASLQTLQARMDSQGKSLTQIKYSQGVAISVTPRSDEENRRQPGIILTLPR